MNNFSGYRWKVTYLQEGRHENNLFLSIHHRNKYKIYISGGLPAGDTMVSFLERLAENSSDKMPYRHEIRLPFFRKRDV